MIDFHCDTFLKIYGDKSTLRSNNHHVDLEKMIRGGSKAQVFANFIDL